MKISLKKILILVGLGVLILGGLYYFYNGNQNKPLHSEVFKVGNGFGYRILDHKRILIQQGSIPAIQGSQVFSSAEDAKKTADLVIDKLLNGEDPRLSVSDIKGLHIDIPSDKIKNE